MFGVHCEKALRALLFLALLHRQPTPPKPILQLVQPLGFLLQALFQQQDMDPFCFFSLVRPGPYIRQQGMCTRLIQSPTP